MDNDPSRRDFLTFNDAVHPDQTRAAACERQLDTITRMTARGVIA